MRQILHVDMDAFFVSVEEVFDPYLKNKPVIVGGSPEGRGVVAGASYAARKYGIHSAMPIAKAKRLCPHAIFLRGSYRRYSEYSAKIFEVLRRYSPLVEPMSLDEAFVDLTGCERLHGPVLKAAAKIRNKILEVLGLNASIGIASNKLLAKIASAYCKPNGMLWVDSGMEQSFLASLPIRRIPGIGPKGEMELQRMGVKSVGDLAHLSLEHLEADFGKWGASLYFKAKGISDSPIISEKDNPRSISREMTLDVDTTDLLFLESTLSYLTEKVAGQLRENKLCAGTVVLKLRYSDFQTLTRSKTLNMPTAEDHILFKTGVELFRKLFMPEKKVRLIGVTFTSLTAYPHRQEELFDCKDGKSWDGLYQSIDQIRNKYGFKSLLRATSHGGNVQNSFLGYDKGIRGDIE
jgi:DNA polymerase IV